MIYLNEDEIQSIAGGYVTLPYPSSYAQYTGNYDPNHPDGWIYNGQLPWMNV